MGRRQAVVEQTRARVLAAARSVLADPSGYKAFTVDAVAQAADVARPTIYYQFGSKRGLIEALCDSLADQSGMGELAAAFGEPEPLAGLERVVAVFARFWAADRAVTRRLRALAALDPDIGAVIAARDERRRQALQALITKPGAAQRPAAGAVSTAVAVLTALTSFETFDVIAGGGGPDREPADRAEPAGRAADAGRVATVLSQLLPAVVALAWRESPGV